MKQVLYWAIQCSWDILQTCLGGIVFLCHIRAPHQLYHGAVVTEWHPIHSMGLLPGFVRQRQQGISYFSFFTESLANALGEHVTKDVSMQQLCIVE